MTHLPGSKAERKERDEPDGPHKWGPPRIPFLHSGGVHWPTNFTRVFPFNSANVHPSATRPTMTRRDSNSLGDADHHGKKRKLEQEDDEHAQLPSSAEKSRTKRQRTTRRANLSLRESKWLRRQGACRQQSVRTVAAA